MVMMVGEEESSGDCLYRKRLVGESTSDFFEQIQHTFREHQQALQDKSLADQSHENEFLVLRCLIPNTDGSTGNEMEDWELVEAKTEKQKNRWDHELEWKEKKFNINESTHRITVKVQGSVVDYYNEWIKVPDTWLRNYQKIRSKNDLLSQVGGTGIFLTLFLIFIMIFVRSRKLSLNG